MLATRMRMATGGGETDPFLGLNAYQALTALGLTSGLQLCLDAGNSSSYGGKRFVCQISQATA